MFDLKKWMPAVGFDPTSSPLWADNHLPVGHVKVKEICTGQGGRRRWFRRSSAELHRHCHTVFWRRLAMTTSFCKAGELNNIDSEFRSHDLGPAVHLFHWGTSMPAAFNVQLDSQLLQSWRSESIPATSIDLVFRNPRWTACCQITLYRWNMLMFGVAWTMTSSFFKAGELEWIPATGFDPVSSRLWAPRAASAPCRCKMMCFDVA